MEQTEEKFELSMRIMGKEVLAFSMLSNSKRKNWVTISVVTIIILVFLLEYALPGLTTLITTV
jgi:hypothetical protein